MNRDVPAIAEDPRQVAGARLRGARFGRGRSRGGDRCMEPPGSGATPDHGRLGPQLPAPPGKSSQESHLMQSLQLTVPRRKIRAPTRPASALSGRGSAQAFSSRLQDTGNGVFSSWANSDTGSSSSSQRNSLERRLRFAGLALRARAARGSAPTTPRSSPHAGHRARDSRRTWRGGGPARSGSAAHAPTCAHGVARKNPGYTRPSRRPPHFGDQTGQRRAAGPAIRCPSA